jgi:hypothetical protein
MATTTSLRARRSAAQLHALAGVEREIKANDQNGQRKYLKDYAEAFRCYESVIDAQSLRAKISAADIVLVGDYHALPASQRFAATLFEERSHPGDRPVVLGVEAIFSRDQHILDEWWRREIDEQELRQRMRFDLDWSYDWPPFYQVLLTAREHGEAIYGLDCMPREDLRKIGARDRHAVHKLSEIRQRHPSAVIVVLFGESHLAPGHLPRVLHEQMPHERALTVLQNVDALYWHAAGEQHGQVEAVRVKDDVVCVFNSTPLEKYESYRMCLSRWQQEESEALDLAPTIYNLLGGLSRFLGMNICSSHNGTQPKFLVDLLPEVHSDVSDAHVRRVLTRAQVSEEEITAIICSLEERGSIYVPDANAFLVCDFQMMYAAEEVARFLHHACRGLQKNKKSGTETGDSFYAHAVEHSLAYFGSRVLYPGRDAASETHGVSTLPNEKRGFEAGAQLTGYMLGRHLYDEYIAGRVSRSVLRRLFFAHLEEASEAKKIYQEIVGKSPRISRAKSTSAGR